MTQDAHHERFVADLAAAAHPEPQGYVDGLWAALLKAQDEFPVIVRGKTAKIPTRGGGDFSYNYADLGDILREVGPILRANGLVLVQPIVETSRGAAIRTTLVHAPSGEKEISDFYLPAEGTAQQVGSLITYWRRYAAQAMLGITTESDSDARDVDVPRRQPSSPAGRSSGPRSDSSGSGAASRTSPSVGVLWADLGAAVSTIATDGGKAEWADFKAEKGWAQVWVADGGKITEKRRDLVEEALRVVRSIRVGEKAAAGEEPWDPLQGVPSSELDTPDVGAADAAEDDGESPYG